MKKLIALCLFLYTPVLANPLPPAIASLVSHPHDLFLLSANPYGGGTPWLVGGNAFSNTPSFGTLESYDISIITNASETAHLYGGTGISRFVISYNAASPAFPFVPKNEAQLEVFGNSVGDSFDQLALHGTSTTKRRAAIVFDSNCQPAEINSCVGNSNSWVQEFELGVDVAPNGGHNFFLFDEVANATRLFISPTGQLGFGTSAVLGSVPGEITTPRINVRGISPTCSVTAGSSDASCVAEPGSTDSAGVMIITTGSSPSSSGYLSLIFSQPLGANLPVCTVTLWDDGGSWDTKAALKAFNRATISMIYAWDNNGILLLPNQYYGVMYICVGK